MPIILDGKKISNDVEIELANEVSKLVDQGHRPPHLVAVLVGEDGPSRIYVRNKIRACERIGYKSSLIKFENDVSEAVLMAEVD